MHDQKKVAMMIIRGLKDFDQSKESDPTKEQEIKTESEHKESDDYRMGPESAMEKFMKAIKSDDCKAACKAMYEFMEMAEGTEYVGNSMHEDKDY